MCEDGDVVELTDNGLDFAGQVPAGYAYVDGSTSDVGRGVLRDRQVLAQEGVVMVVMTVDMSEGKLLSGPEVYTRGWVYAPEAEELLGEAREAVRVKLDELDAEALRDVDNVRRTAKRALGSFVSQRTRRKPIIVPVVMEAQRRQLNETPQ